MSIQAMKMALVELQRLACDYASHGAAVKLRDAIEAAERQEPQCDHIPVTTFGGDFCIKCNEPMDSNEHPQPAIPAGWQLVPVEYTYAMQQAWLEGNTFDERYKAMLAAVEEMK